VSAHGLELAPRFALISALPWHVFASLALRGMNMPDIYRRHDCPRTHSSASQAVAFHSCLTATGRLSFLHFLPRHPHPFPTTKWREKTTANLTKRGMRRQKVGLASRLACSSPLSKPYPAAGVLRRTARRPTLSRRNTFTRPPMRRPRFSRRLRRETYGGQTRSSDDRLASHTAATVRIVSTNSSTSGR